MHPARFIDKGPVDDKVADFSIDHCSQGLLGGCFGMIRQQPAASVRRLAPFNGVPGPANNFGRPLIGYAPGPEHAFGPISI